MLRRRPLLCFFLLTFAFSWCAFAAGIVQSAGVRSLTDLRLVEGRLDPDAFFPYLLAGSFGPFAAALVMILAGPRPWPALASWLRGFVRVAFHPVVYLLALFALPLSYAAILTALGIRPLPGEPAGLVYLTMIGMAPVNGFATALLGAGPLGEEPGWRGYALPRLLERMGDVPSSLVLGLIWTSWHLPVMLVLPSWRGGLPVLGYLPLYALGVVLLAYVLTKLWVWSRGSILLAIWFHGVVNFVASYPTHRGIWDLDGYSDLEVQLIATAGLVATALLFAAVAATPFGRARESRRRPCFVRSTPPPSRTAARTRRSPPPPGGRRG